MKETLVTIACAAAFTGCAGPMTPFGSVEPLDGFASLASDETFAGSKPALRFEPSRQILHESAPFSLIIHDPEGVPEGVDVRVSYNGIDVTRSFLKRAERTQLDDLGRVVKLTSRHLRTLPTKDHRIQAAYRRAPAAPWLKADFLPPRCSLTQETRVTTIPRFPASQSLIRSINRHSQAKQINPYFVSGLIAQESSFNPWTISRKKALGLTQITSLGEAELMKENPRWPRYPGLSDLSLLRIKVAIESGEINARNEWRLDPDLSVLGGVEYLNYLIGYWSRAEKRSLIEKRLGFSDETFGEIVLASYNSGALRVAQAIERGGKAWLADRELSEARKYVKRVTSYCDSFDNDENPEALK